MKTLISILILCTASAFGQMINVVDNSLQPPQTATLPNGLTIHNPSANPTWMLANGWRYMPVLPPLSNGWTRSSIIYVDSGDGTNALAQYTDLSPDQQMQIATNQAIQAAAQAAQIAATQAAQAQATLVAYSNQVTAIAPVARLYRATLQQLFGAGAETNQTYSQLYVLAYFSALASVQTNGYTAQQLSQQNILTSGFSVLSQLTADHTTWSFPWNWVP